jgi:hypothetical protein
MSERPDQPLFRVVRGNPTAAELAALVGVIVARSRATGAAAPRPESAWVRLARPGAVTPSGLPARIGPGAWRASALPR